MKTSIKLILLGVLILCAILCANILENSINNRSRGWQPDTPKELDRFTVVASQTIQTREDPVHVTRLHDTVQNLEFLFVRVGPTTFLLDTRPIRTQQPQNPPSDLSDIPPYERITARPIDF